MGTELNKNYLEHILKIKNKEIQNFLRIKFIVILCQKMKNKIRE